MPRRIRAMRFLFERSMQMYILENWHKFVFAALLVAAYSIGVGQFLGQSQVDRTNLSLGQIGPHGELVQQQIQQRQSDESNARLIGWCAVMLVIGLVFLGDLRRALKRPAATVAALVLLFSPGCYRPFQPVKLEAIK